VQALAIILLHELCFLLFMVMAMTMMVGCHEYFKRLPKWLGSWGKQKKPMRKKSKGNHPRNLKKQN